MRKSIYILTIFFLFLSVVGYGQKKPGFIPPSIDDEEIPVVKTELPAPEKGKDYVVKYFKGITDGEESRIAVKNLGYIIRPAMVQVISEDGRELAIELVKKNWDDIVRSDITKAGIYESSFKTAMEFGIKISAKEIGIPFVVVVSAGKELYPASNLFVDASTMQSVPENTDESGIVTPEPGQSNNLLFIIIAIALVGILALLAVLVFKKKGKGSATLLLMLMTLSINAAEVKEVGPDDVKDLPNDKIEAPGDHYDDRKPSDDDPLDEDDKDHMPNPNPPGQPSLPTSCIETAQNNHPSSSDDGQGSPITKDPTNAEGGTSNPTSEGNRNDDSILEEQLREAGRQFERDRQEFQDSYDARVNLEDLKQDMAERNLLENYERNKLAAGNDTETLNQLHEEYLQNYDEIYLEFEDMHLRRDAFYERTIRAMEESYDRLTSEIIEEFDSRQQDSEGEDAPEKDPNRQPKKDPDRPDDKENSDDEHQSKGNPPSEESPESGKRENPDNQKKACQCLDAAYADLREQQERLENLLIIGQHTKKVTDFGIAFGDNVAGIHAVSGLTWQTQKLKVVQSMNQFNDTYTKKYNEIIAELYQVMMQINSCEDKLGVKNWYAKWGFIYYEFMQARYASYK